MRRLIANFQKDAVALNHGSDLRHRTPPHENIELEHLSIPGTSLLRRFLVSSKTFKRRYDMACSGNIIRISLTRGCVVSRAFHTPSCSRQTFPTRKNYKSMLNAKRNLSMRRDMRVLHHNREIMKPVVIDQLATCRSGCHVCTQPLSLRTSTASKPLQPRGLFGAPVWNSVTAKLGRQYGNGAGNGGVFGKTEVLYAFG
jgi:hypothetical protein